MKKNLFLALTFFMLAIQIPASVAMNQDNVWRITSLEWPPYASSSMPNGGVAIARLKKLLQAEGIELKVTYLPWKEAQEKAKANDYVGYFPAWPSEVNEGFVASPSIFNSHLAIINAAHTEQYFDNLEQLFTTYKVGVVSAFTYPEVVADLINNYDANIIKVSTDAELLEKMNNQQIDVALTDPEVLNYLAKERGVKAPTTLMQFTDFPLVVAMRAGKENNERVTLLNNIMAIKESKKKNYQKPSELFMTYIDIPIVKPFMVLIQDVYNDLGIELKMHPVPAKRGLLLLESGVVDSDVGRFLLNMYSYKNVLIIEPSLGEINVSLLCRYNKECNRNILRDSHSNILSNNAIIAVLQQFDIKAHIVINAKVESMVEMLRSNRVDYVIYPTTAHSRAELLKEFQIVELRDVKINHVINKKHAALLPQLQQALIKRLKASPLN